MGANNIITTTSRPAAWHLVVALVLVACSLVIPAGASAAPIEDVLPASSSESSEPVADSGYASVNSLTGNSVESSPVSGTPTSSGYSSLNAVSGPSPSEPTLVSNPSSTADDGFDWASAAIGAGIVLGMLSLGGAVLLSIRRRPSVSAAATH
jgi:hypothetical protein